MKKILITGGCGFIGSHVVDNLISPEYEIVVIDNLSTGKISNLNSNVVFYNQDITKDISNVFERERPEIVIHMAAQVMLRKSLEEPLYDATVNILGTLNVLECCRKFGVRKIIYTSTGGARVGEPEHLPVDEKHPLNPCSPYGISKHTAEHYVQMYNKLYGLDYLIFCFGNVYGPRDDPSSKRVTSVFIDKILKNEVPQVFGDGEQTRDFIYVKDLAEFVVDSFEKNPEHKLFHLANGKQVSVNYVVKCLKEITNRDFPVIYKKAVNGEVKDICLDTKLVVSELAWKPKHSFEEGLRKTYEWFLLEEIKKKFNGKLPKVLVGGPISDHHAYCFDSFVKSLNNLSYSNIDFFFVDNSKDNAFFESFSKLFKTEKFSYHPDPRVRLSGSRNIVREKAINENYDYVFCLDQDVVPPEDIIERLLLQKVDVSTGVYFNEFSRINPITNQKESRILPILWLKNPNYSGVKQEDGIFVEPAIVNLRKIIEVQLCGTGCILISSEVLRKIKFRWEEDKSGVDDVFFCKDVLELGYKIYADCSIICEHLAKDRPIHWGQGDMKTIDNNS